eukprot:9297884-Pyramimonas_sp.AAC.1
MEIDSSGCDSERAGGPGGGRPGGAFDDHPAGDQLQQPEMLMALEAKPKAQAKTKEQAAAPSASLLASL